MSQILSSQFHCLSVSVSQWHQRVPRLGSECLHRWETPGLHHGWTHTGPGWVRGWGRLEYRHLVAESNSEHSSSHTSTGNVDNLFDLHIPIFHRCVYVTILIWYLKPITSDVVDAQDTIVSTQKYKSYSWNSLLSFGPSSCAASSSWWQWPGCPPHSLGQPALRPCQ